MKSATQSSRTGMGWGGGHAATPGAMSQLPPQRTAKLGRAFRLVRHLLFDWWHFDPGRWGGSHATDINDFPATPGATGVLSPHPTTAQATARPDRGYNLLRLAVALLLLTAAALKGYDLANRPVVGSGLLESRWLLIGVVEMEILFSLWLLANIWPKLTWTAALVCFSLFTCVSLYKALSGYVSCGCFGRVQVNPWYTAILDLGVVLALLRWRPAPRSSPLPPGEGGVRVRLSWPFISHHSSFSIPRATTVLVAWLSLGLPAAYAMTNYVPTTFSDAGEIRGDGKVVVLEPENWIGKRFPLLDYIDIGDRLKDGKWLVLLYHHDCPSCQASLPKHTRLSCELRARGENVQVGLVEVPPFGGEYLKSNTLGVCVPGRLNGATEWFVATPLDVIINHGMVMKIGHETGSIVQDMNNEMQSPSRCTWLLPPNSLYVKQGP